MKPNYNQLAAAFKVARELFDKSGYGKYVTDDHCRQLATAVAEAVLEVPSTPQPPQQS